MRFFEDTRCIIEELKGSMWVGIIPPVLMPPRTYYWWNDFRWTLPQAIEDVAPGSLAESSPARKELFPGTVCLPGAREVSWSFDQDTRVVFANCPFFHPSRQWWFQTSLVVHPSLRKANDNLTSTQLPPAGCIYASTKRVEVGYVCLRLRILDNFNYVQLRCRYLFIWLMTVSSCHSRQL